MLPLGCLPLWGREGVTLVAAAENYRMTGKSRFQLSKKRLQLLKKNQNPAGSTASQRTFAFCTSSHVGMARMTDERA